MFWPGWILPEMAQLLSGPCTVTFSMRTLPVLRTETSHEMLPAAKQQTDNGSQGPAQYNSFSYVSDMSSCKIRDNLAMEQLVSNNVQSVESSRCTQGQVRTLQSNDVLGSGAALLTVALTCIRDNAAVNVDLHSCRILRHHIKQRCDVANIWRASSGSHQLCRQPAAGSPISYCFKEVLGEGDVCCALPAFTQGKLCDVLRSAASTGDVGPVGRAQGDVADARIACVGHSDVCHYLGICNEHGNNKQHNS